MQEIAGYGTYKTNLSLIEQIAYSRNFKRSKLTLLGKLVIILFLVASFFFKKKGDLSNYAFETPAALVSAKLVEEVHANKGLVYAFLSPFPHLKQPEKEGGTIDCKTYKDEIREIVDTGVDGLMTDHPRALEKALQSLDPCKCTEE